MISRSSYNWYESAASPPHLPEYCITVTVSNIVPSSNDVITNQIFIAFHRECRDAQVISELYVQGKKTKPREIETQVIQSEVYIQPLSCGFVKIITLHILLTNWFDHNFLLKRQSTLKYIYYTRWAKSRYTVYSIDGSSQILTFSVFKLIN